MTSEPQQKPIAEAYEDAALEAAFAALLAEEAEALMAREPTEEEALLLAQLQEDMPRQLAQIDRMVKRHERRATLHQRTKRFLNTAAAVLAIAFLSFSTAVAVSEPLRARFAEFLMKTTEEYVELRVQVNPDAAEIPADWIADYYPAYIPDGYELVNVYSENHLSQTVYKQDTNFIIYCSFPHTTATQLNLRNAETQTITIQGMEALLICLDHEYTIVFSNGFTYFTVTANTLGIAVDIAESITPIPK